MARNAELIGRLEAAIHAPAQQSDDTRRANDQDSIVELRRADELWALVEKAMPYYAAQLSTTIDDRMAALAPEMTARFDELATLEPEEG